MKTALFLVLALLCVSAFANPMEAEPEKEEPVTDDQANCISEALRQLEVDAGNVGDLGQDAVNTLRRLQEQRQRCEDILGDPPTKIQERLHETCRLAWSASVAYELNRLRGETDFVDGAIKAVQECRD